MNLSISTPILEFPRHDIAKLSPAMTRKLAIAVTSCAGKSDPADATVEDLLNYFPARYEDRSNFLSIEHIEDGLDAAVEIYVKTSTGYRVGKNRNPRRPPLYVFEITGSDAAREKRPVTVKWFVSGKQADRIVDYYAERFRRGTRFVAYGKWEMDERRGAFSLMVNKPDELEILPEDAAAGVNGPLIAAAVLPNVDELEEDVSNPEFATVHTARRVPIYRKLGPFQTKRLREIVFDVLRKIDQNSGSDPLPVDLVERRNLLPRMQAISEIHFPPDDSSLADYEMFRSRAHRRLIFDEFFWLAFSMQLLRGERQKEPKGTVIEISDTTRERLKSLLPFALTGAQKKVIGEIFADLKGEIIAFQRNFVICVKLIAVISPRVFG